MREWGTRTAAWTGPLAAWTRARSITADVVNVPPEPQWVVARQGVETQCSHGFSPGVTLAGTEASAGGDGIDIVSTT